MDRTQAELIALRALGWGAAQEGALQRFALQTGIEIDDLRRRAADPEFLAAFLDFVLSDDPLTKSFCDHEAIETRTLHRARHLLPGGEHE